MSTNPLKIAFLWHQHQPFYKNEEGFYQMPWVRFHATKDYLDMLLVLREFPKIKNVINLVPSLLLQIEDYVKNEAKDNIWVLTEKPAGELSGDDKRLILQNFFLANAENMIQPYQRYADLHRRYHNEVKQIPEKDLSNIFTEQEFRDLQVWYNLTWMGEISRLRPKIKKLFKKGRNFSEKDKQILLQETRSILSEIIPLHKKMWESGQVELSTTPFYHPILPLLIDSRTAKASDASTTLPRHIFSHPEDAEAQIRNGLEYFEKLMGRKPEGMWPSEGSVSDDTAEMIARQGIRWIATDEAILARSLESGFQHTAIYQPYTFSGKNRPLQLFFRDHYLSDAIGFVYSTWDPEHAAADFIARLKDIRSRIINMAGEENLGRYIVPIILDGENCWEFYKNDGRPFMRQLYGRLTEDSLIETVTFSEFLQENSEFPVLKHIHPGSWINANFDIWIGSEEDNQAWDLLYKTRKFLKTKEEEGVASEQMLQEAWEKIYIAEGSDWCWWYGDEHSSSHDLEFDQLYREHLMAVYHLFSAEVPTELYQTIKHSHFDRFKSIRPLNFVYPQIDGKSSFYYEWIGAAVYDAQRAPQTAMHQVSSILDKLYVGFNSESFFLRLDFCVRPDPLNEYVISIKTPKPMTLVISPLRGVLEKFQQNNGIYEKTLLTPSFCLDQILEAAIPFADLGVSEGERIGFQVHIKQNNQVVEIFPHINIIEVEVPDKSYELREWSV